MTGDLFQDPSPTELAISIDGIINDSQFSNPKTLEALKTPLSRGDVCLISDALPAEFADETYRALVASAAWKPYEGFEPHFAFRHHNIFDKASYPAALRKCEALFASTSMRSLMEALSSCDCRGVVQLSASLYLPGDHSLPHDDSLFGRSVAFVWHLTKHWNSAWGGEFFWCNPLSAVSPAFNTLILFKVMPRRSFHFVSTVSPVALGRRIAVNGWWTTGPPIKGMGGARPPRAVAGLPVPVSEKVSVIATAEP